MKVQRPGIRASVEQDLDIVLRMAARLEDRAHWARAVGTAGVARGFAAAMREELDFRVEARNMAAIAATWPGQQRANPGGVPVVLPAVHERLCTEHVLVIEWLDGVSLRAVGQLVDDRGLDRAELTRALLRSMVYQITEGGVFHADPHPGNIMLLADGRLALLDFGSVGRLDAPQRSALLNLLLAIGRADPAALRDALLELVARADDIDEQQLERALGQFMARHLVGGTAATTEMFTDLFRLASRFELAIPPEIATVLRALATLEGTLTLLTPGIDIAAEARQYAADHVAGQLSPGAVQKTAADELIGLLPVLRRLPRRLDRITGAMEQGRLGLNVRLFADERDRRAPKVPDPDRRRRPWPADQPFHDAVQEDRTGDGRGEKGQRPPPAPPHDEEGPGGRRHGGDDRGRPEPRDDPHDAGQPPGPVGDRPRHDVRVEQGHPVAIQHVLGDATVDQAGEHPRRDGERQPEPLGRPRVKTPPHPRHPARAAGA